jgi:hypothetical protein
LYESPLGPGGPFTQTVDCEFLPGRFFLLFRATQDGPMGNLSSVGVWGYSAKDRAYTHHSFNSFGTARLETGSFDGNAWNFRAEFENNSQLIRTRFIDRVASPNRLEMTGEVSVDGAPWMTVMEGTAERAGS